MFTTVTCCACGIQFSVPDGATGKRYACPYCKTAYGSEAPQVAPDLTIKSGPPATPAYNKTILAQPELPIRYTCPRCQATHECPASDAGKKVNCPTCGQRLQIPALSTPVPVPDLQIPNAKSVPAREVEEIDVRDFCRECGRDITGRERVRSCPDCDKEFCSPACIRQHRKYAHGDFRRRSSEDVSMAVTAMVLGIVAFVLSFVPCLGWIFGIVLGILGATFGAIGLAQGLKTGNGTGMATTGLILGILAILWGPIWYFLVLASIFPRRFWF